MSRLFLGGALAAVLIYAGAAAIQNIADGSIMTGAGSARLLSARQVILNGALILGPLTTLLILEN